MKQLKLFTDKQLPQYEAAKEFVLRLFPNAAIWQKIKLGKRSNTFGVHSLKPNGNPAFENDYIILSKNCKTAKQAWIDAMNTAKSAGHLI